MCLNYLILCVLLLHMVANSLNIECEVCVKTIEQLDYFLQKNSTVLWIENVADVICAPIVAKTGQCAKPYNSWQCKDVCYGVVHEFESEVLNILVTHYLNPYTLCSRMNYNCEHPKPTPQPRPPPEILSDNGNRAASGIGYFIQFPDVHWDPWYKEGSVANCGEPVCCRELDDNHTYEDPQYAGKFGDYTVCDASTILLDSMFAFIKENITATFDLDFIIWVGDAPVHDVWNESYSKNLRLIEDWTFMMTDNFPGIPIYCNLGNHEGFPINQFDGSPTDSWLYEPMAELISQWVDNSFTQDDNILPSQIFNYGGFYTTLVRPGFRIIALHTGYMQGNNFYLVADGNRGRDMTGQLNWLNDILNQARKLNETVWIIQHYPYSSMLNEQQVQYYDVIRQFPDVVANLFVGHTHCDEWQVLGSFPPNVSSSDSNSDSFNKPFAVLFNAGALTPYGGTNPMFRFFSYDRATLKVIDFKQYWFNLTRSNELKTPIWEMGYSMKHNYNLNSLDPSDIMDLSMELAYNDQLWESFQINYKGGYVPTPQLDRNGTVCHLLSTTYQEYEYCQKNAFPSAMKYDQWHQDVEKIL